MRKQYIVVGDIPELLKGALLTEDCDNGDQGYTCSDKKSFRFPNDPTHGDSVCYSRQIVMKQPQFFEEIFMVKVPKEKLAAVNKLLKK